MQRRNGSSTDRPSMAHAVPHGLIADVWWGADGIDALLWGDPPPYADPLTTEAAKAPSEPEVVR